VWEIEGVDDAVIHEFSQRRAEMDEVRSALEARLGRTISNREEDHVALNTRSAKQATDPIVLQKEWLTRADRVGLDIGSCFDRADRALAFETLPEELQRALFADLIDPSDGLCSQTNTFRRSDVMRAVVDWSIIAEDGRRRKVVMPSAEVERQSARFCAWAQIVEIDDTVTVIRRSDGVPEHGGQGEPTFTTIELLEVQSRIISIVGDGIRSSRATVDPACIGAAIASVDRFSDEQEQLVKAWLTSGDRVQCAVGRAGTGKTTTMRVAARAWTAAGYRVLGAAVKGEAARLLANEAEIEADTVAMLLARSDRGVRVLDSRTVLIVDEASTLGDRDLLRLCALADETGAALRLIGDPAQHGSVPAGGSFAELVDTFETRTPQLETVRRLTDAGERRRADLVRNGRVDEALIELEAGGQLVLTDSDHDTQAAIVARWYEQRAAGRAHPMVHGRNLQRRQLNSLAQRILIADGDVDGSCFAALADGRRLCVGDQVVARHGDRSIHPASDRNAWMRNGTRGQIIDIRVTENTPLDDEIDIATSAGVITCTRPTFDRPEGGIDLAYALTSYAVQGATHDVSTSAIAPSTSRSELYVDITRGRSDNRVFGTRLVTGDDEAGASLPRLETELIPVLRNRLARSASRTALALAPRAQRSIEAAEGRTLAGLHATRRRGAGGPDLETAIRRAEAAVRRLADHEPPPNVGLVLPACPRSPHLAARWRATIGEVAVYRAIESPRIRHDQGALPAVIGSRAAASDPLRWDKVAQSLRTTAIEIVRRQLCDHLDREGEHDLTLVVKQCPAWLDHQLAGRADAGHLPHLDVAGFAAVVRDVYRWRVDHGLVDRTEPDAPLGPVLDDPLVRAEQTRLHQRLTIRRRPEYGRGIA
jgi:hypothetical protein